MAAINNYRSGRVYGSQGLPPCWNLQGPEKMMAPHTTPVFQHPAERMGIFFMEMGVPSVREVPTHSELKMGRYPGNTTGYFMRNSIYLIGYIL